MRSGIIIVFTFSFISTNTKKEFSIFTYHNSGNAPETCNQDILITKVANIQNYILKEWGRAMFLSWIVFKLPLNGSVR